MASKIKPIVDECKRQLESCLYSSTACYEVVKYRESLRWYVTAVAFIIGSLTAWSVLRTWDNVYIQAAVSFGAFISGLIPAFLGYMKFDESLESYRFYAARYKNLADRFRQTAQITSQKSLAALDEDFKVLMKRMETLRLNSPAIPEWAFSKAKGKIEKGHYEFEVDISDENPPAS